MEVEITNRGLAVRRRLAARRLHVPAAPPAASDQSPRPRQVSASARTYTVLAHLPLQAVREITVASPVFWRYLAVNVSLKLKIALQRYDELLIADSRARVAAVLLRLAGYDGSPDDPIVNPDIPMTQAEIGEVTRLTRNGLAGILSRLAAEGLIAMGYGHITVANPAALIRVVKDGL
jgi:CRP/FNR family cyclic AMP-dependent transcriptional regulator